MTLSASWSSPSSTDDLLGVHLLQAGGPLRRRLKEQRLRRELDLGVVLADGLERLEEVLVLTHLGLEVLVVPDGLADRVNHRVLGRAG